MEGSRRARPRGASGRGAARRGAVASGPGARHRCGGGGGRAAERRKKEEEEERAAAGSRAPLPPPETRGFVKLVFRLEKNRLLFLGRGWAWDFFFFSILADRR